MVLTLGPWAHCSLSYFLLYNSGNSYMQCALSNFQIPLYSRQKVLSKYGIAPKLKLKTEMINMAHVCALTTSQLIT